MTSEPIVFDEDSHWDMACLIFWADCGRNRIKCVAGRETIAELAGFTHASSQEIGARKIELHSALRPVAEYKIRNGLFSAAQKNEVMIYMSDVHKL